MTTGRVVMPESFQGLDNKQITALIKKAPLGRLDRKIAILRYVERLTLYDIADKVGYTRPAVTYRLNKIIGKEFNY